MTAKLDTTYTIAYRDLLALRRALRDVVATHKSTTQRALRAVKDARTAYLLTFTEEEQARVLALANKQRDEAPQGHFLRDLPVFESFEDAVYQLGTQLIDVALAED